MAFIPQVSELSLFHLSLEDLKCTIGLDVCREKDEAVEGLRGEAKGRRGCGRAVGSCLSCWTQVGTRQLC